MNDEGTQKDTGTVRVVGKCRNSRHRERRSNSEAYSNVNTEESLVWVCPLNEERGFVAYIFS